MTPLQRRQAFAKDNGVATTPFVELKPTDHIKPTKSVTEINARQGSDSTSGSSNSGSRTEVTSKAQQALSNMKASVSFRGHGSTQLVESPSSEGNTALADPPSLMPSLDAPTPRVLALQEKMKRELNAKLSRERNEESRAEQGEMGAYANAVQTLQNAMNGRQTEFGINADNRLKDAARGAVDSFDDFTDMEGGLES